MDTMDLPDSLRYGTVDDPYHMEYDRRQGHYSMDRYHMHDSYEIYYLFSGERGYFIKDRSYTIRAGDLVIIDSNEVHKSLEVGVPNHDRVVMYYEKIFFELYYPNDLTFLLSPFQKSRVLRLNMKERFLIEDLFQSYFNELLEKSPGYELQLRHLAAELLIWSSRIARNKSDVEAKTSPIQQKIKDVVHYINHHFDQPIRLEETASKFYISASYLSRMFKEVTGFAFTDYVNIVRIREAQRLLRETDWSITQISEETGFDNFSHFGKVFKKLTNVPPRDYRNQRKNAARK